MNVGAVFWDIVPYVTIAILVVGTWWRYRYDKFGWTTRSSQLYERRLLRLGSPRTTPWHSAWVPWPGSAPWSARRS